MFFPRLRFAQRVTSDEMASLIYAPADHHAGPAGPGKPNAMAKPGGLLSKRPAAGGGASGGGSGSGAEADGSGGGAFDDTSAAEASGVVMELLARVSVVLEFMHEEARGDRWGGLFGGGEGHEFGTYWRVGR